MTNASAYFTNMRLAREEVAELDAEVDVRVDALLVRQLDVAADDRPPPSRHRGWRPPSRPGRRR
jgi:hypothetical protein